MTSSVRRTRPVVDRCRVHRRHPCGLRTSLIERPVSARGQGVDLSIPGAVRGIPVSLGCCRDRPTGNVSVASTRCRLYAQFGAASEGASAGRINRAERPAGQLRQWVPSGGEYHYAGSARGPSTVSPTSAILNGRQYDQWRRSRLSGRCLVRQGTPDAAEAFIPLAELIGKCQLRASWPRCLDQLRSPAHGRAIPH